jgi:plastocyanin
MRALATLVCVAAAMLGLAGCGGSDKKSDSGSATELEAYDFRFDPTALSAKAGQKVTLTVKNEGSAEHNLTIAEANVDEDVDKGDSKTVTFTAPAAGTYQYFCEYHKASKNMVGTLTVT